MINFAGFRLDLNAWINEPEPDSEDEVSNVGKGSLEIFYKSSSTADAEYESYQGDSAAPLAPEELHQVLHICSSFHLFV